MMTRLTVVLVVSMMLVACPSFERRAVENGAPVVEAGDDQSVTAGAEVLLAATGSDPETDPFTFGWEQVAGVPVSLTQDPATGIASFDAPLAATTVVLALTGTDAFGASSEVDLLRVSVEYNRPPLADTGGYFELPNRSSVRLLGRASDPDGDRIDAWSWTLASGPTGTDLATVLTDIDTRNPLFSPVIKGSYVVELVATDSRGASSAPDTLDLVALNNAPVGRIVATPDIVDPSIVELDGTGSSDPDGDPLVTWEWRVKSAPATGQVTFAPDATSSVVDVTVTGRGVFFLELVVADDEGARSEAVEVILQVNRPPIAAVSSPVVLTDEGAPIGLDASPSADVDGDPLFFTWTRISGSTLFLSPLSGERPSIPAPSFAALELADEDSSAVYELVVSDGDLDAAPLQVTVYVLPTSANFVFVTDGPSALDVAGCGGRLTPCRTLLQGSKELDPDGDGAANGRSMVVTSGAYVETLTTTNIDIPTGAHLFAGRDRSNFARSTRSGVVATRDPGSCGALPVGDDAALRPLPSPGTPTFVTGLDLRYERACPDRAHSLLCDGCNVVVRDSRLVYNTPGLTAFCVVVGVRVGGTIVLSRSEIETTNTECTNSSHGIHIQAGGGTVSILDSRIRTVSRDAATASAVYMEDANTVVSIDRSVLSLAGGAYFGVDGHRWSTVRVGNPVQFGGSLTVTNSVIVNEWGGQVFGVTVEQGTASIWNSVLLGSGTTTSGLGAGVHAEVPFTLGNSIVGGFPLAVYFEGPGSLGSSMYSNALFPIHSSGFVAFCGGSSADITALNAASGTQCNTSGNTWSGNFIDVCPLVDAIGEDYHLNTSAGPNPCVDAGTASSPAGFPPATDIDGEARPMGLGYDIGIDEAL